MFREWRFPLTTGNTFSTNFAAASKRLIAHSINDREVLFSPSSQMFNTLKTSSKQSMKDCSSTALVAILIFGGNQSGFVPGREWVPCLGLVGGEGRGILLNEEIYNVRELNSQNSHDFC